MIVFLYGPDDFRREQKKRLVIGEFKKKHSGMGLGFFNLEEEYALEQLKEFVRAQSIFDTAKLAVMENAFEHAELSEKLALILRSVVEDRKTTALVSERGAPVKILGFIAADSAMSQKFDHLTGADWRDFIIAESRKLGVSLEPRALALLSGVYQNNTWGLITELQKLSNLGFSSVTEADLEKLSLEAMPNYWAVMNGLRSRDFAARLASLQYLFSQNEPTPKIFNVLASQWKEKTQEMAGYDSMVKSGKLEYEESLLDLVLS